MNYYEIGQRIRKFRKACNLTQEQLAETYPLANSTGALLAAAKSTVYEDLCVKALLNALVVVNG